MASLSLSIAYMFLTTNLRLSLQVFILFIYLLKQTVLVDPASILCFIKLTIFLLLFFVKKYYVLSVILEVIASLLLSEYVYIFNAQIDLDVNILVSSSRVN